MAQTPELSQHQHTSLTLSVMTTVLDQNEDILLAISESQRLGENVRAAKYQRQLQENLLVLTQLCDSQEYYPKSFREMALKKLPRQRKIATEMPVPSMDVLHCVDGANITHRQAQQRVSPLCRQPQAFQEQQKSCLGARCDTSCNKSALSPSVIDGDHISLQRLHTAQPLSMSDAADPLSMDRHKAQLTLQSQSLNTGGGEMLKMAQASPQDDAMQLMQQHILHQQQMLQQHQQHYQAIIHQQELLDERQRERIELGDSEVLAKKSLSSCSGANAGDATPRGGRSALVQTPLGLMKVQLVGNNVQEAMNLPVVGQMNFDPSLLQSVFRTPEQSLQMTQAQAQGLQAQIQSQQQPWYHPQHSQGGFQQLDVLHNPSQNPQSILNPLPSLPSFSTPADVAPQSVTNPSSITGNNYLDHITSRKSRLLMHLAIHSEAFKIMYIVMLAPLPLANSRAKKRPWYLLELN